MKIPTPHIEAKNKDMIAKTVLMPGDPLRAKYIAETYLENPVKFNSIRGMNGYTGKYKNRIISIMASGMGMPSIGIYSYELYAFYDVQNIIRIGSCGAYSEQLNLYDLMLVKESWSESSFYKVLTGNESEILSGSYELNNKILEAAEQLKINIHYGRVHSSDVFYKQDEEYYKNIRDKKGCLAVEMESYSLFSNAKLLNKNAACILTVSDTVFDGQAISSEARQFSFQKMMELALEVE